MTTEELKVRVSLDTSGLKSDINKAKQSLKELNKETNVSGSGGSQTNESMTELKDTLEQIRNLNFADVFIDNIDRMRAITSRSVGHMKESFGHFGNAISAIWDSEAKGGRGKAALINLGEGFDSMKFAASEAKAGVKSLWDSITFGAGKVVVAIAAVVTAIATIKTAYQTGLQNAQLAYAAERVGLTTQAYQQWGYVLTQTGGEVDSLTDFIRTLTDVQNQVRDGASDMIGIYERLGMTAEEVASMDQSTMFARTIEALQNVKDEVERTSLAYRIFGEDDAAKVMTILNMTNAETEALIANYQYLGATMSGETVQRSQILASAVNNLKTAWQGLKNTLSHLFMPALTAVINAITKAIAIVNMFLKTIFGIDLTPSASKVNAVADGYTGYSNAADNAAESTNGVTKAIQKLKRVTMGFDELNKLPGKDEVDSGADSTGLGLSDSLPSVGSGGGLDLPTVEDLGLGKWQDFFTKYKELIQDVITWSLIGIGGVGAVLCMLGGNWIGALKFAALAAIGFGVGSVEGSTFDRLTTGYNNVILNTAAISMFAIGLTGVVLCLFGGNWVGALKFAAMAGIGLAVGSVEGGVFHDLWGKLKTFWGNVKTWFNEKIKPIFTKQFWIDKWAKTKEGCAAGLDSIRSKIKEKWGNVKEWFGEYVKPKFTKKYWQDKFDTIKEGAAAKLDSAKTTISTKWGNIKKWFDESVKPKFTLKYWKDKFDNIRSAASSKLSSVIETVQTKWGSLKKWFNNNIKPKFTISYWKGKFDTIKSGAKSAFNGIISVVETAVNGIIRKINTLSWKIPKWVPKYGGSSFGFNFNTISIPRLATGGIATNDTLAHIGEGGFKEAVLPLDRNTEWMDRLADKIAARNNPGPTKVVLTVDGKELGWATINNINSITKQTGGLPLQLV